jgi:CheY-like chemotaxis protein
MKGPTWSKILQRNGYNVIHFKMGMEAIDAINSDMKYDAALIDLALLDVDGQEVVYASKRKNPDILVVSVSGYELRAEKADFDASNMNNALKFLKQQLDD